MNHLHGTTTGETIFKEVTKMLIHYNPKGNLLRCVVTDGGKNKIYVEEDLVDKITKIMKM